jgi:hypothetical protein
MKKKKNEKGSRKGQDNAVEKQMFKGQIAVVPESKVEKGFGSMAFLQQTRLSLIDLKPAIRASSRSVRYPYTGQYKYT